MQKSATQMRAKRVEKTVSSYSLRSFFHGFACATFLSYFGFFFYFAHSGHNLPSLDPSTLASTQTSSIITSGSGVAVVDTIPTLNIAEPEPESVRSLVPSSKIAVHDFEGAQGPYTSKNLVLGIAVNIDAKNFAIFAHSLRKVSPQAEATVFMNSPIPERHRLIAATAQIRILSFDIATMQPEFIRTYHPSSLRWILFERLLHANENAMQKAFSRVIMVDVRDTVFQSDPFVLIDDAGHALKVFAEAPGANIASCGWNSGWIQDCFGEKVFESVKDNPIICSGISMGNMEGVVEYITKMSSVLLGQDTLSASFPTCERNGVDQGVHNVLVHTRTLSNVTIQYEYDFPVVNLQAYPQLQVTPSDPSILISESGVQYAIVHQYDRLSPLQTALAVQYVDWVDIRDYKAEWEKDSTCAMYTVSYEKDLFRGKCELGSHRVMSAASCCQVCQSKNKVVSTRDTGDYPVETVCSAFTYVDGVCYMKTCRQGEVLASLHDPNQAIYDQLGAVSAYVRFS